jgi:hypothetical protein
MYWFDMEMFKHEHLNKVEGKEQYRVELPKSFAALKTLTLKWVLLEHDKLLGRKPIIQLKRGQFTMN